MREAAMSSMARVIFLVDSMLLILRRSTRSCPPAMALRRFAGGEALLEVAHRGGELVLGQGGAAADGAEEVAMPGAEALEQLGLEPAHVGDVEVVDEALGAGEDRHDLL